MAKLSGSVGEGAKNAPHDVALVQLMLTVVKSPRGVAYLNGYDGQYGPSVGAAITSFQNDHALGKGLVPGTTGDKKGAVAPGGETLAKLSTALATDLQDVRASPGISIVYLDMGVAALRASVGALQRPDNNLLANFSAKLIKLVSDFYASTGIVLTVQEPFGWWRSFDAQVGLASQGGPGETIHNYGRAVDIAFHGLRWVTPAGRIVGPMKGDLTDGKLSQKQRNELWAARLKEVDRQPGLFGTIAFGGGDLAHLQDLEDGSLNSAGSLVALMESVGPRKMKWELFEMTPTSYKCDFGLGGEKHLVGTAIDIWVLKPGDPQWQKLLKAGQKPSLKLAKADLAKALNAKMKADATFSIDSFFGTARAKHKGGALTPADISDADMKAVHVLIRGEFQAAADNWRKWKPVLYPDDNRRDRHLR